MKRFIAIKEKGRVLLYAAVGAAFLSILLLSCGGYGGGGGSAPMSFMLVSPINGAGATSTPTLTWTGAAGATSYAVQVDDGDTFTSPVIDETVAMTTYTVTTPLVPGTYFWRVIANNYYGTTTAGPTSFVVPVP